MKERQRAQGSSAEQFPVPVSSKFAKLGTRTVISCLRRLEDILVHPEKLRRRTMERRTRPIELQAAAEREIHQRARAGDQEAFDFLAQRFVDYSNPLIKAELPEVPPNLQRLSNQKLDQLTADVEQRITRFAEFYPNLDREHSRCVRDVLDARRRSLRTERASRGLQQLPARMEAGPPAPGADAAKKEIAGNAPRPEIKLSEREKKISEIIRRGSKGLQYCRELHKAGIKPRRSGSWKDCPGTYPAAYQAGEPWRHRIQHEKWAIGRKAALTNLSSE